MRDIIVFLESDAIGTGALFFNRARALGLRPMLFSTAPERFRSLAEFENATLAEMSERSVLDAIERLGRDRVRGVWALRDRLAGLAARVAAAVGRPGADPGAVERCRDKVHTRQALADAGVKDVPFALVRSRAEAAAAANALGGRVVVKPRSATGSVGARLCRSFDEVRQHHDDLVKRLPDVASLGALIEAAADGPQFSVQMFDGRSIGVTRQDLGPPPAFITTGLDFPWCDHTRVHGEIVAHAERATAVVGHVRGPGSVDVRYGSRGPCIIEINPRLAGDMIPENIRLATGVDVVEATIRFACGMPYELAPRQNRASATRWLLRPGTLVKEVRGRDEAARVAGVVDGRVFPALFGRDRPAGDFRDRLAYVIAEAESAAQAGELAALGLRQLRTVPITAHERWRRAIRRLTRAAARRMPAAGPWRAKRRG